VKYLLDTGVWLWTLSEPERLSREAREVFTDSSHEIFLSVVTSWEIAIKISANKLRLPEPPEAYVPRRMTAQGLRALEVSHSHALAVSALPAYHRDPFDRLLVAQARLEDLILMTADRTVSRYPARILWAGK
jgi:PIN domain nuclease of toxin-antitoxin system